MLNVKKLLGDVDISKDLSLLLFIGGLYALGSSLSNTFVNIYLWKQSGNFVDIAIYNLAVVVLQPLTFIVAGRWAKKVDRVIVLRIGVIFLALFFVAVLFFGENSSKYLIMLGALLGIGSGFYWLAFNVLTFEITEPETRDFFNGFQGALSSAGGMIGPISAGFIITRFTSNIGYTIIFTVSLILFAAAVFVSFYLQRRPASGQYMVAKIFKERKPNANWRLITNAHFFQGIREGSFVFIISVLVFITTKNELALGTFGLLNAGLAFVVYTFAARFIKKENRKKVMVFGGLLLYATIFLLIFGISYPKLLFYAAFIGIAYPLMLVPYSSMTYDVIGQARDAAGMRIEYIVVREVFLNVGRITSILAFIFAISLFDAAYSLPVLLLVLGGGNAIAALLLLKIEIRPSS